jgi:hypothetical protein
VTDDKVLVFDNCGTNLLGEITGKAAKIIAECAINDEPIFPFRASDVFSVMVIMHYLGLVEGFSPSDPGQERDIVEAVNDFKAWQKEHRETVRFPD